MINRAEETLESSLVNRIVDLEKRVLELTTKQPIGSDVILVDTLALAINGPVTLIADQFGSLAVNFVSPSLQLWNGFSSVTIDGTDAAHAWPNGSALSTGQKRCRVMVWWDMFLSKDPIVGGPYGGWYQRQLWAQIENTDSVSHDFYLQAKGYTIKAQTSTV